MKNAKRPSKVRWTSKLPTRAGLYEWRGSHIIGTFVGAVSFRGEPTVTFMDDGDSYPLSEVEGEWRKIRPS